MTIEDWHKILGVIGVLGLAISAILGAVSWVISYEIERRQQAKMVQLETAQIEARTKQQQVQTELLKQQERAAKAEKELLELQERFKGKSFLQLE
jgi:hypothetical protein